MKGRASNGAMPFLLMPERLQPNTRGPPGGRAPRPGSPIPGTMGIIWGCHTGVSAKFFFAIFWGRLFHNVLAFFEVGEVYLFVEVSLLQDLFQEPLSLESI